MYTKKNREKRTTKSKMPCFLAFRHTNIPRRISSTKLIKIVRKANPDLEIDKIHAKTAMTTPKIVDTSNLNKRPFIIVETELLYIH